MAESQPVYINIKRLPEIVAEARKEEREACAKICDEICTVYWDKYKGRIDCHERANRLDAGAAEGAEDCAEAIRKRGE